MATMTTANLSSVKIFQVKKRPKALAGGGPKIAGGGPKK